MIPYIFLFVIIFMLIVLLSTCHNLYVISKYKGYNYFIDGPGNKN